eukprot:symbB.v1.2.022486.t1/scaffold1990.1/size93476/5
MFVSEGQYPVMTRCDQKLLILYSLILKRRVDCWPQFPKNMQSNVWPNSTPPVQPTVPSLERCLRKHQHQKMVFLHNAQVIGDGFPPSQALDFALKTFAFGLFPQRSDEENEHRWECVATPTEIPGAQGNLI